MAAVPMKMSPTGWRPGRLILVTAVGVAAMILLAGRAGGASHEVTVLRGETTAVNQTRTAIFFDGRRVAGPRLAAIDEDGGWIVAGASWFDGRSWHNHGTPDCLKRPAPQAIELGVLEAAATDDAPGRGVVVWLRCLGRT